MCYQDICVRWNHFPLWEARFSTWHIKCPFTKLWLPKVSTKCPSEIRISYTWNYFLQIFRIVCSKKTCIYFFTIIMVKLILRNQINFMRYLVFYYSNIKYKNDLVKIQTSSLSLSLSLSLNLINFILISSLIIININITCSLLLTKLFNTIDMTMLTREYHIS